MIVLDLNLPNVRTGSVSSARGSEPERKVNVFTALRFEHVIGHARPTVCASIVTAAHGGRAGGGMCLDLKDDRPDDVI